MGTGYGVVNGTPHKLVRDAVNLGLAVNVERKDGSRSLLVPVVRDAGALGFGGFRGAYDDLVRRTRAGQIKPDELRGATISLTNPGGLGTVASVPRLMPGQGTIVATGAIGYPPGLATVDPAALRELGVEKVMTMTSTYDHRVIQGAESGEFLARIEALLQGEDGFYDDVRRAWGWARPSPSPRRSPPPRRPFEPRRRSRPARSTTSCWRASRRHVGRQGPPQPRPPGRRPRPAGRQAARRPRAGARDVGLTPEVMARIPASLLRVKVPARASPPPSPPARRLLRHDRLRARAHLRPPEAPLAARGDRVRAAARAAARRARVEILERLVRLDAFERFLRRTYLGQKTFSIEGVDALVPITDRSSSWPGPRAQGRRDGDGPPRPAGLHRPCGGPPGRSRSWPSSKATWPSRRARGTCARRPAT